MHITEVGGGGVGVCVMTIRRRRKRGRKEDICDDDVRRRCSNKHWLLDETLDDDDYCDTGYGDHKNSDILY